MEKDIKKNKKMVVIISIILVLLVLIGGFAFLKIKSSPKNIFITCINEVFDFLDEKDEINTIKSNLKLSSKVEGDSKELNKVKEIFNNTKIQMNVDTDRKNMIINENLIGSYDNKEFINAKMIFQDEKVYIYLKDIFDKYLELPNDNKDDLKSLKMIQNINQDEILDILKDELLKVVSKQEFKKEKQNKFNVSILDLGEEDINTFLKNFLNGLKENKEFEEILKDNKKQVISKIDELLDDLNNRKNFDESNRIEISIFSKGIRSKFQGILINIKEDGKISSGIKLMINDDVIDLEIFDYDKEIKRDLKTLKIEKNQDDKDKGKILINILNDDKKIDINGNYEIHDERIIFELNTNVEDVNLKISGNIDLNSDNYNGKISVLVDQKNLMKILINCDYNVKYNEKIEKENIENSVFIENLSEQEQTQMLMNLQKSELSKVIGKLFY